METRQKSNASEKTINSQDIIEGEARLKSRNFKEALVFFDKAVKAEPDNARAWHDKAEAEAMCLKYDESIKTCQKAIDLSPENVATWFLKSFSHGVLGQYQEALDSCTRGLELDPSNNMVWCTRGQYLYALGKLEESLESFGKALQMNPENPYFKEVNEKVKKWLQRDGQNAAWADKVITFLQQGGFQDALNEYKISLNVDPRAVSKTFEKDYALAHLVNPEKMMKDLEKTKALDQPQIVLELSQKEFEFSRESWVELIFKNTGKTLARDISLQFPEIVSVKQLDISPELIQQMKTEGKAVNLDTIPSLAPDASVKKLISLTPKNLGQVPLEVDISYIDAWDKSQSKTFIIWISVFKPNEKLPSVSGYKTMWRLSMSDYSNIYIAQKVTDSSRVVLKMIQFSPEQTLLATEYLNEIKQCSKMTHPNIIRYIQYGDSPCPWVIMEYMPKGTLSRKIGRLNVIEAMNIADQLLNAISYARSIRITHRGISPDNILFDNKDVPKLTNFRTDTISQRLKNKSVEEIVNAYYTPERLFPRLGGFDWTSDVYQWAVVLFEMIAGHPPFQEQGKDLITQIESVPPPKLSSVNSSIQPELDTILTTCLAKNKKDRYRNFTDLSKDFSDVYQRLKSNK